MINLSQKILTPAQSQVLNKGLGFVPTPMVNKFDLQCELQQFFRKIRLKAFFKNRPYEVE